MDNFHVVVVMLLLACAATTINSFSLFGGSASKPMPVADVKGRLLTPAEGCGYSKVQHKRIVGGSAAKPGAWPWIALLGYRGIKNDFGCGGSLITSRHVLSAAHCISPLLDYVRLGEHDTRNTKDGEHQDIKVIHSESHEHFSWKWKIMDIAIVYLEHDVKFDDRIRPICLPINGLVPKQDFVDQNPFLAGWGVSNVDKKEMSSVLNQVQIPVITNELCKNNYIRIPWYDAVIDYRVLCTLYNKKPKDTCQGDSGGPVMLPIHQNGTFPFYQIGVISHSEGCARENIPGVNTNVQSFADWINKKLDIKANGFKESA